MRLTHSYSKYEIRFSGEIPNYLSPYTLWCRWKEESFWSAIVFRYVRSTCTCFNIWGEPMELCIPSLFISFLCDHPKVILPIKEEKLDLKSYSKDCLLHAFPGLTTGHKELLSVQTFPSTDFLHVQWQDRCCYGLWSWRSTNNESVLLLLRTEPSWWQGGLKSCQVWIQNEVSGRFLRHTLRSMLQGLSRVHSGVPRLDALWCLLK